MHNPNFLGVFFLFGALTAHGSVAAQDAPKAFQGSRYSVRAETLLAVVEEPGLTAVPLDVSLTVPPPSNGRLVFEIPIWTPGSYRRRPFAGRMRNITAFANQQRDDVIKTTRIRDNAWEVLTPPGKELSDVTFAYRTLVAPNDRFMFQPETRRAITFEGPAIYVYAKGLENQPCAISFDLPDGWNVYGGLERDANSIGPHAFRAPNYDVLADCPLKLGTVQTWSFESMGAQIDVVLDAGQDLEFEADTWIENIQAIVDEAGHVFGGIPVEHYVFLYTASPRGGGGGLEHLTSTAIGLSRRSLARSPRTGLSVTAHEFFHLWNVKRLRPIELGPFQYDRPVRTDSLWLAEGVTSYYTDVLLSRADHSDPGRFWERMRGQIRSFENRAGRYTTSSEQASRRVWDNAAPDRGFSYYNSGCVLGLLVDLQIRHATNNERSADDWMRALFARCEKLHRGLTPEEIVTTASQVAGIDMAAWFDRHVAGTVRPDYAKILGHAGMRVELKETAEPILRGLRVDRDGQPTFTDWSRLDASSSAQPLRGAGILVAVDEQEWGSDALKGEQSLAEFLTAYVEAHQDAFADGRLSVPVTYRTVGGQNRTVRAGVEPSRTVVFDLDPMPDDEVSAAQRAIREGITAPLSR